MAPITLVPLSISTRFREALREWLYKGDCEIHGAADATCDLCWEDTLRYHFRIVNWRNGNQMWVGSHCINHFGIRAVGASGEVLGIEESARKVRRDQRKMSEDLRTRHVEGALDRLAAADQGFGADFYKRQMGPRNGFAPDQARDLMARFEAHGIEVAPSMFRVTLRHQRDREALEAMSPEELRTIWRCLTASQRRLAPSA
jgi:hypothetical protein